jgi:hypothetical protein
MKSRGSLENTSNTYTWKWESLEQRYNFLDTYGQPKSNQEDTNHLK